MNKKRIYVLDLVCVALLVIVIGVIVKKQLAPVDELKIFIKEDQAPLC